MSTPTVRELHDRAMQLAQDALLARGKSDVELAQSLARQAYELEAQAASMVPLDAASEPTRSILFRSAASLAYQAKELQTAQRLIAQGLCGYPPPRVERELKHLFDQINFDNHLQVSEGVELQSEDLQVAMQG